MRNKRFDCVEMKREGSRRVYEAIKGMSIEQEVVFWREQTAEFRREMQERKKAKAAKRVATGC